MKIAIDTSPLHNLNAARGVGMYTRQLVEGLSKLTDGNEYLLVKDEVELQKIKPDLIHYPFFDLFFRTLPKRGDLPVVVTVHDVTPLVLPDLFPPGIRGKIKLYLQKKNLQSVDKIITDSQCSKKDIARYLDIPLDKIETVYLACDPVYQRETDAQKLTDIKTKYNLPEKYIVRVGDINKHKNFHALFDALTRTDPDIHLVLVGKALGEDAPMIAELQEIVEDIQNFSLQKRVHRLGFVPTEDMSAIYTAARATMHNSLYEGFGLTALESLHCGTPVIAGDTGSQPEIVGNAGLLVNPYDVNETAGAIEEIFAFDEAVYKTLQEKSIQQAKKFSLEKMTQETVDVYESLQRNRN